jgi:sulfatase maturation enzyme AslB (radical SAM superfamily)
MANISITNVCNTKCDYCFANDAKLELGNTYLNVETYKKVLDYVQRSGLKQARILGGEPTLHPDFFHFIEIALDRNLDIMLFTNGLVSSEVLKFLCTIPNDRLSILLNTIYPNNNDTKGLKLQIEFMEVLGEALIPGANIYNPQQRLDYLLDYVCTYNLKKEIRLGIAHPVLSQNNVYLHPKEYHKIGNSISDLKLKAQELDISLCFDCGFVPCMFPTQNFELLSEELKKAGTCCHPIIDMLTDGSFISCYPLNNLKKVQIHDQLIAKDLVDTFEEALKPYKSVGIFPYCSNCQLLNKRCNGGCMSYRIKRFLS